VGFELMAQSDKHKLPDDIPSALLGDALDLDPAWAIGSSTVSSVGRASRRCGG
jgi:hypothetical protein